MIHNRLSQLLLYYERQREQELKAWRIEQLESHVIPHQTRLCQYNERRGLPNVEDRNILEGLKREYKTLTGREYV